VHFVGLVNEGLLAKNRGDRLGVKGVQPLSVVGKHELVPSRCIHTDDRPSQQRRPKHLSILCSSRLHNPSPTCVIDYTLAQKSLIKTLKSSGFKDTPVETSMAGMKFSEALDYQEEPFWFVGTQGC
jgi:hypothetical protein